MKREIITIDEEKCNGCGLCVPGCPEGALQIIDGKARLVSDLFCDGLGACVGECPQDALHVVLRETEEYDESKVMGNIVPQGKNTIKAHLKHLIDHGADSFYNDAVDYLRDIVYEAIDEVIPRHEPELFVCPGSAARTMENETPSLSDTEQESALIHWPVQMHLMNPRSPHFKGSDFLLAADCTAFSSGGFHGKLLAGKTLGIACPKLDSNMELYADKILALIDEAHINTLTIAILEVPCCQGLLTLVQRAQEKASRKVPVKMIVVGIDGNIQKEEWL